MSVIRGSMLDNPNFHQPPNSEIGIRAIGLQSDFLLFIFTPSLERRRYSKDDPVRAGLKEYLLRTPNYYLNTKKKAFLGI